MSKWIGPLVVGVLGVVVLVGLGLWQMQRLEWKEGLIADLDAQMSAEPMALEDVDIEDIESLNGLPVVMRGEFGEGHTDLLTASGDTPGYRRFVPFATNNMVVLAELGFLPASQRDAVFVLPEGEVELKGHVDVPRTNTGTYDPRLNVWVNNNAQGMAEQLGTLPILIALEQSPIEALEDTPMTIDLVNNHLQYAITWFLLALVWALMTGYWVIRRKNEKV